MKKTTLINLLLLTSTTIFTACSTKDTKPKNRAELFQLQQEQIAQLPMATTYPMDRRVNIIQTNYNTSSKYDMQQIEVIDTHTPPRRYSSYQREQHFQPQPQHVAYTNYRNNNYRNNFYNITRQIENNSKQLLGKKYVWGATGPYNYDCSSFTQKVYRDAGINIPRVSREQARVGQYINYNNLRKGDMVFFDTKKQRTGRVSHVGIYLGNGNFIHASSGAKKVVIFNFNEKDFYKKRFLWGRRVIRDNSHMASL
jgi:cell wall-associated NlpC family hydrolase